MVDTTITKRAWNESHAFANNGVCFHNSNLQRVNCIVGVLFGLGLDYASKIVKWGKCPHVQQQWWEEHCWAASLVCWNKVLLKLCRSTCRSACSKFFSSEKNLSRLVLVLILQIPCLDLPEFFWGIHNEHVVGGVTNVFDCLVKHWLVTGRASRNLGIVVAFAATPCT